MANQNLLAGLAGFAQGFAPAYTNARNAREQLLAELEQEKRKRMQQESAESYRWMNAVPGITLPEAQSGADFMGQTVDDPMQRGRLLEAAKMSEWTPEDMQGLASTSGLEGEGPTSPTLQRGETQMLPGAQAAYGAKRKQSSEAGRSEREKKWTIANTVLQRKFSTGDPFQIDKILASMDPRARKKTIAELAVDLANNWRNIGYQFSAEEPGQWAQAMISTKAEMPR